MAYTKITSTIQFTKSIITISSLWRLVKRPTHTPAERTESTAGRKENTTLKTLVLTGGQITYSLRYTRRDSCTDVLHRINIFSDSTFASLLFTARPVRARDGADSVHEAAVLRPVTVSD